MVGPLLWRVDLRRAVDVTEGEIAAWRGLLVRAGSAEPVYADPDFLLAAAQHQAGGRDLVFAFAWSHGNGPDRLHGVVPLAIPHPMWGNGQIAPWQPHGVSVAPTIEAAVFDDVRDALADHLASVRPRGTLVLSDDPYAASPVTNPGRTLRSVPKRVAIPADALVGIRSAESAQPERPAVERISEPDRIRDAVEAFLILDAEVSPAPIIGDPSEAALVRVVTRLFAQRRQASVELTRCDGAVVAATLRLGVGTQAVVWRQVAGVASLRARSA
ncbi:hypothetical protein G3T14_09325 [Methylobacterium sp. BTF04]|nr:hypothetical protein [Methylobacterium sp. BTF04]